MVKSKKGMVPAIILLVILVAIIIVWVYHIVQKECSRDDQCPEDYYCGSDFTCHEHKVVDRTVVYNYDLFKASIILGIAMIICVVLLKSKRIKHILGWD